MTKKMSFREWYNEADMPEQDKDGKWFDMETGIYFDAPVVKVAKPAQHEKMSLKLDEMKRDAQRVVEQEKYLDRTPEAVKEMKIELISFAKELLNKNAKKADYCKMYDMRTAVSQAENKARK